MFFSATVFALFSALVVKGALQIDTPSSVVVCEPVAFHFSGGTPPYYVSLIPAGQPAGSAFKQFPSTTGNTITWNVDMQSGTAFSLSLRDGSGNVAFSDKISIQAGPDDRQVAHNVYHIRAYTHMYGLSCINGGAPPPSPPENTSSAASGSSSPSSDGGSASGSSASGGADPASSGGVPAPAPAPTPATTAGNSAGGATNAPAPVPVPSTAATRPPTHSGSATTSQRPSSASGASRNHCALGIVGGIALYVGALL
ncbi:hypothetical protein M422DRAFT_43467 [Sphaerobolus stellatus SS14]|nr:hypothetical protein M422DRAFT_43467 [Sphaerobolus stellatus SS14]